MQRRLYFQSAIQDLSKLCTIQDEPYAREVQVYNNNGSLLLLDAEPVILAMQTNGSIDKTVFFHPRYVRDPTTVHMIECRGFTQGRTIDIYFPDAINVTKREYELYNFKGVGAFGDQPLQADANHWFDHLTASFVDFNEIPHSLGRRWGLLDSYEGTREFNNNHFEELGLPQVPHLSLNEVDSQSFDFSGFAQLVRGLTTNVRCDNFILFESEELQRRFVDPEKLAGIDSELFKIQSNLFKKHMFLYQPEGNVPSNRYIDGTFTDMENYTIRTFANEKESLKIIPFLKDVMGSAFQAMNKWPEGRQRYLQSLESNTSIPFTDFRDENPNIFLSKMRFEMVATDALREQWKNYYGRFRSLMQSYLTDK